MTTTLTQFPAEEIVPLLGYGKPRMTVVLPNGDVIKIKAGTPRLQCLARNQSCAWCGRTGNVFILERCRVQGPHLNLYCFPPEGGRVLMTQDHIIPKSRGGKDHIDNLITMCASCNQKKGALLPLNFVCRMTGWRNYHLRECVQTSINETNQQ